jgi:hypothetical protein
VPTDRTVIRARSRTLGTLEPPMDSFDPGRARDHLATYAFYSAPARRLARIELLVIALLIGAVDVYVGGAGGLGGPGLTWLSLAALPVMAILAGIAFIAPPRLIGPSDPVLEIAPDPEGLRFVARSGSEVRLRWADPEFDLRLVDYSGTRSPSQNVVRVIPGHQERIAGGIDRADSDGLVAAARAHGMQIRTTDRRLWFRLTDQRITEVRIGPRSGAGPQLDGPV